MARVRNAFKIRAADTPIIETSQFLQLYCPLLLDHLERDDLFVPKLIVVRGSPGAGKSSLLRLFETDTLLAVHARRSQPSDRDLVERLTELGILDESGPRAVGIYIQCDSSLRDLANLPATHPALRLFNTLLDTRVIALFLRAVQRLASASCLSLSSDHTLQPLPSGDSPPELFSRAQTICELEAACARIENDFGQLLNSFPDDPLPTSIQAHARVYSLAFLALQLRDTVFANLLPIIMLDDVQELNAEQRDHLRSEFMRRASIPRWLAVRTQVFGLEELISLEGAQQGRDYREIPVDEIFQEKSSVFTKFAANVVHRRLQHTDSLQQVSIGDFKDLLRCPPDDVSADVARKAADNLCKRVAELHRGTSFQTKLEDRRDAISSKVPFEELRQLELELIGFARQVNRGQLSLLPDLNLPEITDGKTIEAATLFATERARHPYYWGFDTLAGVANGNVEQLLSMCAVVVDRMIYRAELDRDKVITAKEQEDIFIRSADEYLGALAEKYRRGASIRQFVDNLGLFFHEVTYRPNAPIAPGVNGFGLTRREIEDVASPGVDTREAKLFREVLTNAVAGNVLTVRVTKQGQAGLEKIVFYFNRMLCVRFRLPLNYGGWQHLSPQLLVRMMHEPVPLREMTRRGSNTGSLFRDDGAVQ
jgi:hypothetical protein